MLQHIFNVVGTAGLFFLVSLGLLLIFSVMDVINLAHSAFLTVGAYVAVFTTAHGWNPWWAFAIAPVVGCILGAVTERLIVRHLYHRPLDTILATWGLSIVLVQVIASVFGRSTHFVDRVIDIHAIQLFGAYVGRYWLLILLISIVLGATLALFTRYTNAGNIARAVVMNPELAKTVGINTARVNAITFALGSSIAAFAGVVLVPLVSADPTMGRPWLIITFMVALAAGPSLAGLAVSALLLSFAQIFGSYYISPIVGSLLILFVPMAILRILPNGLSDLFR